MRRHRIPCLATFVLLALGGCASIRVTTSHDPGAPLAEFRTYAWSTTPSDPSEGKSAAFRRRARKLVDAALSRKGYAQAAPGQTPDAFVRFYAFVEEETGVVSDSDEVQPRESYLPPGPASSESESAHHARVPAKETDESDEGAGIETVEVDDLEVGDLVLDLVDAETGRLAWRAWARGFADPDAPDRELESALDKALVDVPRAESR
jgi:hypothetical protein